MKDPDEDSKQTCDIRLADKDGNQVSLNLESLIVYGQDESSNGFRTAVIDVNRIREWGATLKETEERFRLLRENAPLAYQSVDKGGFFLEINPVWSNLLGYSR